MEGRDSIHKRKDEGFGEDKNGGGEKRREGMDSGRKNFNARTGEKGDRKREGSKGKNIERYIDEQGEENSKMGRKKVGV